MLVKRMNHNVVAHSTSDNADSKKTDSRLKIRPKSTWCSRGWTRYGAWLRAAAASVILWRFAMNIVWLHGTWSWPPSISNVPYSRATATTDSVSHYLSYLTDAATSGHDPMEQRRRERRARTTPPITSPTTRPRWGDWRLPVEILTVAPPGQRSWTDLCQAASLNDDSRVAVTGGSLTQPGAVALALLVAKQCNVKNVYGIDDLFPNHLRKRVEQMDTYRLLKQNIETVTLSIPEDLTSDDDYERVVVSLVDFAPTHIFHFDTQSADYATVMSERNQFFYALQSRLQLMNHVMQAAIRLSSWSPPRIVHITSEDTRGDATIEAASVLSTAYHGIFRVPLRRLEVPLIYGPLVRELGNSTTLNRMYVDEAVAAILQACKGADRSSLTSFVAQSSVHGASPAIPLDEAKSIISAHEAETKSWFFSIVFENSHLGNAAAPAVYLDTYGIPQTQFPCLSNCVSSPCTPSAFDELREIVKRVTEDCYYVLYITDFRESLQHIDAGTTEEGELVAVCRVAFVSGKSRLVQETVFPPGEDGQSVSVEALRQENGKFKVNGWMLLWLPEDDFESLSPSDRSILRIDPSQMFAAGVKRALYTESPSYMRATDAQLKGVFSEMDRERVTRRQKRVRKKGRPGLELVMIPRQRARKAIFFAKEKRDYKQCSLHKWTTMFAPTPVPPEQSDFYQESAAVILSDAMRTKAEMNTRPYDIFPYQWLYPTVLVHDFSTKFSQDFRCGWYKEYLEWGLTGQGSELLSLSYLIGKHRLDGSFGGRLEDDPSWTPLYNRDHPDYPGEDARVMNARGLEIYLRVIPKDS